MQLVYGDAETYYDKEYTLKEMTPAEYILDPRWETIGWSITGREGKIVFIEGDGVADLLRRVRRPWAFVSYNALFDASILAYRYKIYPDLLIDTMGVVRAVLGHSIRSGRVSLEVVSKFLALPGKGTTVKAMSGVGLKDLKRNPRLYQSYKDYCVHDTWLLREITNKLAPLFPKQELKIMDMILKMATIPQFQSDIVKLSQNLISVIEAKQALLNRVNCERVDMLSSEKFANILRSFNIDPPMKPSPRDPLKLIYAFAKTDFAMQELSEHPNPDVQALIAARLGARSTLEETRTRRFIGIGQSMQRVTGQPWMPIALRYGGAHTHRFSGEWKINQQNLPARKKGSGALRESLIAPAGMCIIAVDASQIEARIVAWLADEVDLLREFAKPDNDVYAWYGSEILGYTITKKTHPIERFNFKTIVLGLGYQMGASKLMNTLKQGATEAGLDVEYTLGQCEVWVDQYRTRFKNIKTMWRDINNLISYMANPKYKNKEIGTIGPCSVSFEEITLPSKLKLYYDELDNDDGEWRYKWGRETRKLYGGKITENIVQALDRQHVMEAALRIEQRIDYRTAHNVHDEIIYIVKENEIDAVKAILLEEMRRVPTWGAGLPLDAEVKVGKSYGGLK